MIWKPKVGIIEVRLFNAYGIDKALLGTDDKERVR